MRPATPSECPGFWCSTLGLHAIVMAGPVPAMTMLGRIALEAPAGIAAAAEHERRSGAAASHPYCQ
jgi:hypothetical protein